MPQDNQLHRSMPLQAAGAPLEQAATAMIMLHGRGATAQDILGLVPEWNACRALPSWPPRPPITPGIPTASLRLFPPTNPGSPRLCAPLPLPSPGHMLPALPSSARYCSAFPRAAAWRSNMALATHSATAPSSASVPPSSKMATSRAATKAPSPARPSCLAAVT